MYTCTYHLVYIPIYIRFFFLLLLCHCLQLIFWIISNRYHSRTNTCIYALYIYCSYCWFIFIIFVFVAIVGVTLIARSIDKCIYINVYYSLNLFHLLILLSSIRLYLFYVLMCSLCLRGVWFINLNSFVFFSLSFLRVSLFRVLASSVLHFYFVQHIFSTAAVFFSFKLFCCYCYCLCNYKSKL